MASELKSILENSGYNVTISKLPGAYSRWIRSIHKKSKFKSPKDILKDIIANPKKYENTGVSMLKGRPKSKDTPKNSIKESLDNINIISLTPSQKADLRKGYKEYKEAMNDKNLSYEDYKSWAMAEAL